jgi:hypothetical protein
VRFFRGRGNGWEGGFGVSFCRRGFSDSLWSGELRGVFRPFRCFRGEAFIFAHLDFVATFPGTLTQCISSLHLLTQFRKNPPFAFLLDVVAQTVSHFSKSEL